MRILHLPHAYPPARGGAEILCRQVGVELVMKGHQVRTVVPAYVSAEGLFTSGVQEFSTRIETDNGVEIRRVSLDRQIDPVLPSTTRPQRLRRRLDRAVQAETRDFRPDVILALPHLLPNVKVALSVGHRFDVPVVMVPLLHEDDPNWPHAELEVALSGASAVIAMTEHERDRLIRGYAVAQDNIFVSGLGIEAQDTTESDRRPMVLFLGRLAPSKNLDLAVSAMRLIWRDRPDVELVIAGSPVPGTDTLQELRELATTAAQVTVVLDPDEDRKLELLRTAACLVSTSMRESFGLVLLEAMACGAPVVALNTPVNQEVLGGNGFLCAPTPEAVAEALRFVLQDEEGALAKAESARRRATTVYRWEQVANTFLAAYEHASQPPRGSG